jgi:hypothetical protein
MSEEQISEAKDSFPCRVKVSAFCTAPIADGLGRLARIDITLPEGQQVPMRLLTPNGFTLGIGPIVQSLLNTFYLKISCQSISG